jgi:ABC-type glycerol-3-phosphate transport system permease component
LFRPLDSTRWFPALWHGLHLCHVYRLLRGQSRMASVQVDLSEIGSVKLYANYLLRTVLTIVATVVCVSMVAYQVSDGKRIIRLPQVHLTSHIILQQLVPRPS